MIELDLGSLTVEHFTPHRDETFEAVFTDGIIRFELKEAVGRGPARPGRRAGFSLIFRGPADLVFPQQVYPLEHPALGMCEIFLVPIGREDGEGSAMLYQAVFS